MSIGLKITIAIIIVIAVAAILTIIYLFVYKPLKYKKKVNGMIERYQRTMSTLTSSTLQSISKLEKMSLANANYISEYNAIKKEYELLKKMHIPSINDSTSNLEKLVSNKDYKNLKVALPKAEEEIESFCKKADALDTRVNNNFKEEEEVTTIKCNEQAQLRNAKSLYRANKSDLKLVEDSYAQIFEQCDSKCEQVDTYIASGQYSKAKRLLEGEIHNLNVALNKTLEVAPHHCVCISQIIPSKLEDLKTLYIRLLKEEYPIKHIIVEQDITRMQEKLKVLEEKTAVLNFKNVGSDIDAMLRNIEKFSKMLNKEVSAKETFSNNKEICYQNVEKTSNKVVSLINNMPILKKAYLFDESTYRELENIKKQNEIVMKLKNELYNFEHSCFDQPYSLLLAKMTELDEKNSDVNKAISNFEEFLGKLKSSAEDAHQSLSDYTIKTRDIESLLISKNLNSLTAKYQTNINTIYSLIDELYLIIKKHPLDVKMMNKKFNNLANSAEALYEQLDNEFEQLDKAEKAMVELNSSRLSIKECDRQFKQSEQLFYSGNFVEAANQAINAKLIDKEQEEAQ